MKKRMTNKYQVIVLLTHGDGRQFYKGELILRNGWDLTTFPKTTYDNKNIIDRGEVIHFGFSYEKNNEWLFTFINNYDKLS